MVRFHRLVTFDTDWMRICSMLNSDEINMMDRILHVIDEMPMIYSINFKQQLPLTKSFLTFGNDEYLLHWYPNYKSVQIDQSVQYLKDLITGFIGPLPYEILQLLIDYFIDFKNVLPVALDTWRLAHKVERLTHKDPIIEGACIVVNLKLTCD